MPNIRAFIAITLAAGGQAEISRLLDRLRALQPRGVKWCTPGNVHFTLAFLGPVAEERLEAVYAACGAASRSVENFPFQLGSLGTFPPHGAARVIWLGLSRGQPAMGELQTALAAELGRREFSLEARPFFPHLTLGRVRPGTRLHPRLLQVDLGSLPAYTQPAAGLCVMRSDLQPAGARYTLLRTFPLGG